MPSISIIEVFPIEKKTMTFFWKPKIMSPHIYNMNRVTLKKPYTQSKSKNENENGWKSDLSRHTKEKRIHTSGQFYVHLWIRYIYITIKCIPSIKWVENVSVLWLDEIDETYNGKSRTKRRKQEIERVTVSKICSVWWAIPPAYYCTTKTQNDIMMGEKLPLNFLEFVYMWWWHNHSRFINHRVFLFSISFSFSDFGECHRHQRTFELVKRKHPFSHFWVYYIVRMRPPHLYICKQADK